MDFEEMDYVKSDGVKQPYEGRRECPMQESQGISTSIVVTVDQDHSKGEPFLETSLVFVISGGERKEKNYFKQIMNDPKIQRMKFYFVSKEGQGLGPTQMNDLANEYLTKRQFIDYASNMCGISSDDTIYLLQDMDEYKDEITAIFKSVANSQVKWIVSNPCFEIWLFYHKFDTPEGYLDCGRSLSVDKLSGWLKEKLNELIVGGANPIKLFSEIRTAVNNSKANYGEIDELPQLYSTQMHILADTILCLMGNEFEEMQERRRQQAAKYIKLS